METIRRYEFGYRYPAVLMAPKGEILHVSHWAGKHYAWIKGNHGTKSHRVIEVIGDDKPIGPGERRHICTHVGRLEVTHYFELLGPPELIQQIVIQSL